MAEHDLEEAVRRLAVVFDRRHVRHALIGGLAVGLRSRPRATKDADFILHIPAVAFPGLLDDLAADGFEIDVVDVVRRWSADKFVVFYRGAARVDWMQPVVPLYARVLDTAEPRLWLDAAIRVATAEGLILTKLVAFRPQDQADIVTLLAANRDDIDVGLIRREWAPYATTEADRTAWFESTVARVVPPRGEPSL
jgi:hypothetical protein